MDGQIDTLSAAFGALQGKVETLIGNLTADRQEATEHRYTIRTAIGDLGTRMGILENTVQDMRPQVKELVAKDTGKEAVRAHNRMITAIASGALSTIGTVAYAVWKAKYGG